MAVLADLALAGFLTILLLRITNDEPDAIPRPLALLALYTAPGIVGALGVLGRRRSLLFAAGLVLGPGSLLSLTGVTLIFALPMALFWAAGVTMGRPMLRSSRVAELAELTVSAGLMLGAAVALFATSWSGCSDSGSTCGSGFLSQEGVGLEVLLLAAAILFATSRARRPARGGEDGSPPGAPA